MKHSGIITAVCLALAGALPVGAGADVLVSVPNIDSGAENLEVTSIGATTASTVGFGNYVVGPADVDTWIRPIVQFPVSSLSSLAGLSVVSATLHYSIHHDFTEPGEFGTSNVRMFTTGETELSYANRNVFAGLSGDGGAHTVVGSASFIDGVTGAQSLVFSAAALTALEAAINGVDPTLVIAFREFAVSNPVDSLTPLDEFVLGVPPGNMSIEITAVPEPGSLVMLAMGGLTLIRWRRHDW